MNIKKKSRALAGILCFCMLMELCPDFSGGGANRLCKGKAGGGFHRDNCF